MNISDRFVGNFQIFDRQALWTISRKNNICNEIRNSFARFPVELKIVKFYFITYTWTRKKVEFWNVNVKKSDKHLRQYLRVWLSLEWRISKKTSRILFKRESSGINYDNIWVRGFLEQPCYHESERIPETARILLKGVVENLTRLLFK